MVAGMPYHKTVPALQSEQVTFRPVNYLVPKKYSGTFPGFLQFHPIIRCATSEKPITREEISQYHSIVVSDTSRQLPPSQSSGTFSGQATIVVPSMDAKILAQVQGVGVGYLPRHRILNLLKEGRLVEKTVTEQLKDKVYLKTAWRTDAHNQAMDWFLEELDKEEVRNSLL